MLDRAESARARAGVPQNHEGRGAMVPALAAVGAFGALADRMQTILPQKPLHLHARAAIREGGLQPIGQPPAAFPRTGALFRRHFQFLPMGIQETGIRRGILQTRPLGRRKPSALLSLTRGGLAGGIHFAVHKMQTYRLAGIVKCRFGKAECPTDLQSEFLVQLADNTSFQRLALADFPAREFPLASQIATRTPCCQQHLSVPKDQSSAHGQACHLNAIPYAILAMAARMTRDRPGGTRRGG